MIDSVTKFQHVLPSVDSYSMKVYLDQHYVKLLVVTMIFSVIEEPILSTTTISIKLIKNHIYWHLLHLCHVCADPLELLAYLCG